MRAFLFSLYLLDILVVAFMGYGLSRFFHTPQVTHQSILLIASTALMINMILSQLNGYRPLRARHVLDWVGPISGAVLMAFGVLLLALWLLRDINIYSRLWLITWLVANWCVLLLIRAFGFVLLRFLHQQGLHHRKLMIVGDISVAEPVMKRIQCHPECGYDVTRIWSANDDEALVWFVEKEGVQDVWIVLPLSAERRIARLLSMLRNYHVDVRYIPDMTGFGLLNHRSTTLLGIPMLDLSISPISDPLNRFIKRCEDILLGVLLVLLATPMAIVIALLIKLSSRGPVLFKQVRGGFDGQSIMVYKFRTMYVHEVGVALKQAIPEDERVTPIGRLLRRTSMDELPQLFNVLQGRMSLVGPRPHALEHDEHFKRLITNYVMRYRIKPGITGWAQVHGWRGETNTREKLEQRVLYDLFYIENWSLGMDLKILLMTIVQVIRGQNAY